MANPLVIWAISDGRAGLENQVVGLAEALGRLTDVRIQSKRISIRPPHDRLPRVFFGPSLRRLSTRSDRLDPPYPDIAIGCGRRAVPLVAALGRKGVFTVQTQDPRASIRHYDVVVPPVHDGLTGPNVVPIIGAPNRLSAEKLAHDARALREALPPRGDKVAAVLIGGDSKDYKLTRKRAEEMAGRLAVVTDQGYRLLISPSRRTPEVARDVLKMALPEAYFWDGEPVGTLANPYLGMLGLADRVFVTEESANMLTDAAFTGKPVHLLKLDGGAPKWERFHESLEARGVLKPGASDTDLWAYDPLRETDRAAAEILSLFEEARGYAAPRTSATVEA